jgi:voltage-gated potassium channel
MAAIIAPLELIAGKVGRWLRSESIYWSFITVTTVGYGDIPPKNSGGRVLSILIALVGVTFPGIIVALAINSATLWFGEVHQVTDVRGLIDSVSVSA